VSIASSTVIISKNNHSEKMVILLDDSQKLKAYVKIVGCTKFHEAQILAEKQLQKEPSNPIHSTFLKE
jgi:hypothetical protein